MKVTRTAVAVTAALAIAGLGTTAAVAADTQQAAQECQPGTLKATTADLDDGQHGMNHEGTYLKVTNTGDVTCAISGYAGLALEGAGHTAIATDAEHGDTYFAQDPGEHQVTLEAGDSAYADLEWTHTGADSADAHYLQISPTGSNSHSTVPFAKEVDNSALTVTAWSDTPPTA
ncbi:MULTISPECIES: DUF4232 domain-containing protein [Streptomyces]|uniref:DUF4232 domain-containing protein n=1 Tax=Streptomyces TaxID=1883 RepID=UPI0018853993|nr:MULTISPECIES: DUF4232 domain-containing protein [Streptomyces]MBF8171105.1 DUF4232 domain-containing protein [Streptomyces olivaceus]MBZ6248661.1 DUF4232 domain-containing protein [Streptomyces olivaceus]MBZ6254628.1 DUF4232 domain-containing protein [Streptomyces olivaceus]MCM8552012.1 DUF4232 domain-containing protein [Streptomyces sp. STCH 565 A]